jgi:hypothetical protein
MEGEVGIFSSDVHVVTKLDNTKSPGFCSIPDRASTFALMNTTLPEFTEAFCITLHVSDVDTDSEKLGTMSSSVFDSSRLSLERSVEYGSTKFSVTGDSFVVLSIFLLIRLSEAIFTFTDWRDD